MNKTIPRAMLSYRICLRSISLPKITKKGLMERAYFATSTKYKAVNSKTSILTDTDTNENVLQTSRDIWNQSMKPVCSEMETDECSVHFGLDASEKRKRALIAMEAMFSYSDMPSELVSISHSGNAFQVVDLKDIESQFLLWKKMLPRVRPFYAVKCNPNPVILSRLATLEHVIYANPCKQISHLKSATKIGVSRLVFDDADELHKIAAICPDARILLRIRTNDLHARCRMSNKFGADLEQIKPLLMLAASLNLKVEGLSFHVGSGNGSVSAWIDALQRARKGFDYAHELAKRFKGNDENVLIEPFTVLDIGGGFPGAGEFQDNINDNINDVVDKRKHSKKFFSEDPGKEKFIQIATKIRSELDRLFPPSMGRFLVASSHTLATNVIARRVHISQSSDPKNNSMDYINSPEVLQNFDGPSNTSFAGQTLANMTSGTGGATLNMSNTKNDTNTNNDYLKKSEKMKKLYSYFINDGIYGSFNCIVYDHAFVRAEKYHPPSKKRVKKSNMQSSSVFGETCDGLDCVLNDVMLPEMEIGDWLFWQGMGAYTSAAASSFNGFEAPSIVFID